MQDVRRVVGTSPPRPDSPTSPTIPPPVARDAPNPGPLQRPLTRSRSSLAHAPAIPFPPSRIASPQFPNTSVPGGLVVAMHEPRMVPIPRGLPGGPASAAMRECEVFGVSPSGYATLRAGQASGWTGAAAQDARMHALERRSASGSLYQEAVRDFFMGIVEHRKRCHLCGFWPPHSRIPMPPCRCQFLRREVNTAQSARRTAQSVHHTAQAHCGVSVRTSTHRAVCSLPRNEDGTYMVARGVKCN